ncbi:hypothetical protein ACJRO7_000363 [Eucalyptus globulus]|uniref:NAC domain-containing protein n=1 Tax=Eucalyptus globulus TaxID=34317 RepID=A0ABD3LNJ7_EUCGL
MESIETSLVDLPVGFRFRPTDDKLIIPEVDVHQLPPWDLPGKINELSRIKSDGDEWFLFSRLQNKYPQTNGQTSQNQDTRQKEHIRSEENFGFQKMSKSQKASNTKLVLHEYGILNDQSDFVLYRLKKNPDENGKKNSKTQKTDTGISIVPQEGSRSSPNLSDEVNNISIPIMPQEGSRRRPNTPDESNNTSCSNTLVIAKSIIPEEIPKPPTATGEQFSPDSVYQDLESYFADTELLQEILEMLTP